MNRLLAACGFAAAIIFTAISVMRGWIDREVGETLLIVVPILAVTSLGSDKCCRSLKGLRS